MYCFRHKTLHRRFRYGLPAIAFFHVLLACLWLLYTHGWLRLPPAGGAYLCMKGP